MIARRETNVRTGARVSAALAAWLIVGSPLHAQDKPNDAASDKVPAKSCEVPEHLLTSDEELKKTAEAIRQTRKLDVLVVGTGSSSLSGPGAQAVAYPASLEVALRQTLEGVNVSVAVEIQPRATAADTAEVIAKLLADKALADRKPALVVWQTGTIDAMRAVDLEDFRTALEEGIAAIQEAGADVVLMNMQYSPRTETIISASPYMDMMKAVAQQHDVVLFDRFAVMHHWSETGEFDLYGAFHGLALARRVHECIGRALAAQVRNAAHLAPQQSRIPQ
jgi:hypothetical protein